MKKLASVLLAAALMMSLAACQKDSTDTPDTADVPAVEEPADVEPVDEQTPDTPPAEDPAPAVPAKPTFAEWDGGDTTDPVLLYDYDARQYVLTDAEKTGEMLFGDVPLYYATISDDLRGEVLYRFDDSTPVDLATVTCTWNSTFDDPAAEVTWTMSDDYSVFEANAPVLESEDFEKTIEAGSSTDVFYYIQPDGSDHSFYVSVQHENNTDAALPYNECPFSFLDAKMPSVINGVDLRTYAGNDDTLIRNNGEEGAVELDLNKVVEAIGTKPAYAYVYWMPYFNDAETVFVRDTSLVWNTTNGGYLVVSRSVEDNTFDSDPNEMSYFLDYYDHNSKFVLSDSAMGDLNDAFGGFGE